MKYRLSVARFIRSCQTPMPNATSTCASSMRPAKITFFPLAALYFSLFPPKLKRPSWLKLKKNSTQLQNPRAPAECLWPRFDMPELGAYFLHVFESGTADVARFVSCVCEVGQ